MSNIVSLADVIVTNGSAQVAAVPASNAHNPVNCAEFEVCEPPDMQGSVAMHGWRISKYDPRFRDEHGLYQKDEWIGAGQIGEVFPDGVLSEQEYLRVEDLYVSAVLRLWIAAGEPALQIRALETSAPFGLPAQSDSLADVGFRGWFPSEGASITQAALIAAITRWCLREFGSCELVAGDLRVSFGYDYYLHVATTSDVADARRAVLESGLFIEPYEFVEPERQDEDEPSEPA
jgi:hypothetical protein